MLRVGLVGLGDVSFVHLDAIERIENAQLVGVCDIDEACKSKGPENVPFFTDWAQMIEETKPDVVHLCLPHYMHYEMTKKVLEKGVHVFTEKPLALDLDEAEAFAELAATYAEKGQRVGLCLQNRYNKASVAMKEAVESGKDGAVRFVKGEVLWFRPEEYYQVKPWRGTWANAGGGVMMNQTIHTLDLMCYFGGQVDWLDSTVTGLAPYNIEVEDTVSATFKYKNGAIGHFFGTFTYLENKPVSLRVGCEKAVYELISDELYRVTPDGERTLVAQNDQLPGNKTYYGAGHFTAIKAFYKAVIDGTEDFIRVQDGVYSIRLIDAIQTSALENRCVKPDEVEAFTAEKAKDINFRAMTDKPKIAWK